MKKLFLLLILWTFFVQNCFGAVAIKMMAGETLYEVSSASAPITADTSRKKHGNASFKIPAIATINTITF